LYSTIKSEHTDYRGAGGIRLRLSEQVGLEVSFEIVQKLGSFLDLTLPSHASNLYIAC